MNLRRNVMSVAIKMNAVITDNKMLAEDIYSMWLEVKEIACGAKPGQFVSLYCKDGSKLLPRPISICEIDREKEAIRLVYRIVGKGTKDFAMMKLKESIEVMGPLGNGFTLEGKKALLIGGGIGIPPMLELAKQLNCEIQIVLGYRDTPFLDQEFLPLGMYIYLLRMAAAVPRVTYWMPFVNISLRRISFMPADRHRCFVEFSLTLWRRVSKPSFPWKNVWPVVSEPV
jgi:hypothetical protein